MTERIDKTQHHCIDEYIIGRCFVDDVADWKIFLSLCGPREVLDAMLREVNDGKGFYFDDGGTFYGEDGSGGIYHFYFCDVEMAGPLLDGPPAKELLPDREEAMENEHTSYLTLVANVEHCDWCDEEEEEDE